MKRKRLYRKYLCVAMLTAMLLAMANAGAYDVMPVVSSWATDEVAAAYDRGWVDAEFDMGQDFTKPVSREQFARLTVDMAAAAKGVLAEELARENGISLVTTDTAQELESLEDETVQGGEDLTADEKSAVEQEDAQASTDAEALTIDNPVPVDIQHSVQSPFADTDNPYVALAATLGLVNGDENEMFHPGDTLSRSEAAAMLHRLMTYLGRGEANAVPQVFADAYAMPRWSIEAVKYVSGRVSLAGKRVMSGDNGVFAPNDFYTIEEAIVSLARCADSLEDGTVQEDWKQATGYDTVTVRFTAGGDCTFGRGKDFSYRGSFDEKYDVVDNPAYFFSGISEFHDDDLTMVNFEGTLTTATQSAVKQFVFKGRPEYAKILPAGSVDVVTVANNHSMDYLKKGFDDTVRNLSPYVVVSGYERQPMVTVKGVRIGFVSNVGWSFDAAQKRYITNAIAKLRGDGADVIVFNYHWGTEGKHVSNGTQRAIARYSIDSGADLVIGHHPHVVQEVETYRGKQIAYSLGNLVFGGNKNPSDKNCLIFRQEFTMNLDTRSVATTEYKAAKYRISSVNNKNDYHPVPA